MKLERATPESVGISSQALLKFLKAVQCHEIHSFMLLKDGKVICERWWEPYGSIYRHQLYSLSKSFTSTAVGMAVDEGRLTVDTLLSDIFKTEFKSLDIRIDDEVRRMTIKHLLIMSTGMEYEGWAPWDSQNPEVNHIVSFLSSHVKDEPGQIFRYSSIATYMLSAAITRLTGETLVEYMRPRLFEPLGITPHWGLDEKMGVHAGGFGLNVTTEDIAKFGQFILQKGEWQGKQLVSAEWIEEATGWHIQSESFSRDGENDWTQGYGYQFWRCKPEGVFRGDGMFGQFCVIVPSMNMVIVANSNGAMDQVLDLFWDMLEDIKTLPADGRGAVELLAYDGFSHLDTSEVGEDYPVLLAEYEMEDGSSLIFDGVGNECLISIKCIGRPFVVYRFVKGKWIKGAAPNIFTPYAIPNEKMYRVITYGVWKNHIFEATTWHYESASRDQHRFIFNKDFSQVTMESRTGAFDSPFEVKGTGKRKPD